MLFAVTTVHYNQLEMWRIHPTSGEALHTSGCGWLLRGSARAPPLVPFEARCHGPACQCALSPGYQTLQATVGFATSYAIGEAMVATAVVTTFLVRLARYVYGHGRSFSSRGCRSAVTTVPFHLADSFGYIAARSAIMATALP